MKHFSRFFVIFFLTLYPHLSFGSEIEISESRYSLGLVKPAGAIHKKYRDELLNETGVHGNIKLWDSFKAILNNDQQRGIAGEEAARFLFKHLGYQILEEHYQNRLDALRSEEPNDDMETDATCTTKKGPDNGIDGIFILESEAHNSFSHIVINEAKFRGGKETLGKGDFGFVQGRIQQSHSEWNKSHFDALTCIEGQYDSITVIRTATLLDRDGVVKLYEIRDADGQYASEAHGNSSLRKFYDLHIGKQIGGDGDGDE